MMKRIQLGGHRKNSEIKGYAIVDDVDFKVLNRFRWSGYYDPKVRKYYATRGNKTGKTIYMHREILETPKGFVTDHKDGDTLNNQRNNLRICTDSENKFNSKVRRDNTSGFKGVFKKKGWKKYYCKIRIKKKDTYVGCFDTKEEAARAYNEAALKHYGEFASINVL